jgi:DNA-binding transcriptional MocR family regulator
MQTVYYRNTTPALNLFKRSNAMSTAGGKEKDLTPDGNQTLFDTRETEKVDNLIIGAPGTNTLRQSVTIFSAAAAHRAEKARADNPAGNGSVFQYGPRAGFQPFREELAKFLTQGYGGNVPVEENSLIMTTGATVGLWLSATVLLPAGRGIVFIEVNASVQTKAICQI